MFGRLRLPAPLAGILTLAAIGAVLGSGSAPAAAEDHDTPRGSIGVRLLDAALSREANPRARLYIEDHVRPGTTIVRHVLVTNNTGRAQDVTVYPGPASIRGGSFVGAPAGARSELSTWTSVDQGSLRLPQGGSRRLTVRVAVPDYASRAERYGVVWASIASGSTSQGVRMVNRVGVRIYLDVGPGGEDPSGFVISDLTARRLRSGAPVVRAAVRNTGGRALDLSGTLLLTGGPGGLRAGPFPVRTPTTLAPGQRGLVSLAMDDRVPTGPWRARLSLHSGLVRRAATGAISFPEAGGSTRVALQPVAPDRPARRPLASVTPLVGAGMAVLAGVGWFVLARRRRRDVEEDPGFLL